MSDRKIKVEEALKRLAATFLEKESDSTSLITVTKIDISPDFKNSIIYISVLPDTKALDALNFCKRKMTDFKRYVKDNMSIHSVPFFSVELDFGEKNRQRIEELSHENKDN
jgi:ribosome-binding factor A